MNLDKSRKLLSETECFFLLNHERAINKTGDKSGILGQTTPLVANQPACEMELPDGENYAVQSYYSKLTNELYSWVYNSNGVHYIQRINGDGTCEVVYHGSCLQLSAEPQHTITQFRAYLQLDKQCANRHGKALVWTNGNGPIGMIDTEASIATNFFTTPFFERCAEGCEVIQMCVPDPCGCLKGVFIPLDENDKGKKNNLVDVGIKFSFRHIYYDNRASIWAEPSTLFFQDTKGCFDNTDGFPRCIELEVPLGNPLVDRIEIAFWQNGIWYSTEIVEKYKKYNTSQQYWYERELAELNITEDGCHFKYIFCNDKQCDTVESGQINRVYNPTPINPQGILPIGIGEDRTALGFYNYEQGNCPVDKIETEKISIGIDCPKTDCEIEYATVKVRAIIHNLGVGRNQFIYRLGNNASEELTEKAYFGGLNATLSGGFEIGYGQYFEDKTRNFIVYIDGTDSWSEMKQFKSHSFFSNREEWGIVDDMNDVSTRNRWRRAARNGEFFYQEAEIKVIKGTRGFLRLASHHATGNSQDTSTFVRGIQNLFVYKGDLDNGEGLTSGEEIYFDTCDGDVDITNAFVIDDNAVDSGLATKASAYNGYVKDNNSRRVEGAIVEINGVECITDHNGFYHLYLNPGENDAIDINVKVEQDCFNFTTVKTESVQGAAGVNTSHDIKIDNTTYSDGFYANVKIRIQDCQGNPIGGVRVSLSGSKYDVTDADGYARWRIRNYESRDRAIRTVVMNNNGCFGTDCNGVCNPCMPTSTSATIPCYYNKPTITITSAIINRASSLVNKKGLKAGGRYGFAAVLRGDCGIISAANELVYIDIPKTQEKNKQGFCSFTYNSGGAKFPGYRCIDILRTINLNPFELQWVVDKIERVDGRVKLTIQSLNDYNEKYFFNTNTIYKWLKGDRIEFIKNGDGKIFSIVDYGLLNYLTISPFHDQQISGETEPPADYFNQLLIDDDGKLDELKEGAVIEIQRSKECTTDPVYFGICVSIPLNEDGSLVYPIGVFETFDTYFVSRVIGKLPTQQFEHFSPSDFWGGVTSDTANGAIDDTGRPYFVNKYENKRRLGRNITINAPNEFNYFGDLVKTIDPDNHGDITAMWLTDNKIGFCLSEHDNSLFEVGNDLLKVGGDGIVRAVGPDGLISDSQPKLSGNYGCQYPHIGGVFFGDGYASWVDVNKHTHAISDYSSTKAADEGKAQTYFRKRCQELETLNRATVNPLDKLRFITGLNQHTGALHITIKSLRHSGIYNEIKPYLHPNDTIMYHPPSGDYLGFSSPTPEAYGQLNLFDGNGCAMVMFLNGIPYIHPIVPLKWNEFFGVAVDRVVGISMNKFPDKIKKGLAIEIQDETMWFVADVSTENANFVSEVPAARVKQDRNKWNCSFLKDKNSRGGLYNGRDVSGFYHAVTFVRDNTDDLKYGTTNDSKRIKYDALDLIHFKFLISEQSGFTENL